MRDPGEDRRAMALALRLARRGVGFTAPNPLVGAVVVRDGVLVGKGWHRRLGGPHAEVEALREAGEAARGATLYVTLEPCNHHGRTPPCTAAVLAAGIRRVVIAAEDPNPQVTGGGAAFLRQQGLEVECGLLVEAARRLNEAFYHAMTTGRPWVMAKVAATLDGKIATRSGDSRWVTGEVARRAVHQLRHEVQAILVGVGTAVADDPQLTTRLPRGRGQDPIRIILDSGLRLPATAQVLHLKSAAPTWVACTARAPLERRRELEARGAEVLVVPGEYDRVNLPELLKILGQRQVHSLLVEGGAEVHWSFFSQGLVNKALFFLAPKLVGGREAPGILGGPGVERMKEALGLADLRVRRVGEDLLITARVPGTAR